ncbi:adenosine deaminase [Jiangella anatolica]|uniref:Adenosine deaminase n=1 Tax=Jiangella anatolica TaxID=2670374 RepID=A0A2W2B1N7_9ACTN|nr:adenosine deaminase [Jiangella anatolica]PZF81305.1 adenosine deaminase [Jiangella anatolica]
MTGTAAIAALPKAELHLHLVGSASVQTVLALATRTPGAGVPLDPAELAAFYTFRDFAHFIDVYNAVDRLVTTPADVTTLVVGAARDAAVSNVRWLELTVTAATHLKAGIDGGALRAALEEGRERARSEHGVEIGWIVDIPGEQGLGAADATVDFLTRHAPAGTVAIGLAGLEPDAPRRDFVRHVAQARDLGLRAAIHAGEASGPESVHDALSLLHADRIGHGLRAADDPSLVAFLADAGTPLEVCVTSNVCTGVVAGPDAHPVAALAAAGVVVVPGTDDPGMFGTDLNAEYALVARLTGHDPADLARAGVAASFAPDAVKAALLAELGA